MALVLKTEAIFHMILSSNVADIHEAEDMLLVQIKTQSTLPCHNLVIARYHFGAARRGETRTVLACQKPLLDRKSGLGSAAGKISDLSMFAVPPFIHNFPNVWIYCSVDLYAIFRF